MASGQVLLVMLFLLVLGALPAELQPSRLCDGFAGVLGD
jgi:hypothetical protein